MKLADSITIIVDGDEVVLRPSLRCAMLLERSRKGSFPELARELMDGSLTAAVDIVEPHADLSREYLAECILPQLDALKPVLLSYVMACTGIDPASLPANDNRKPPSGQSQTFAEYLIGLYRIGTGWLGWTPDQTLDATIPEITEAQKGRHDLLKAIFGTGTENTQKAKDTRSLEDKFRGVFAGRETVKASLVEGE